MATYLVIDSDSTEIIDSNGDQVAYQDADSGPGGITSANLDGHYFTQAGVIPSSVTVGFGKPTASVKINFDD